MRAQRGKRGNAPRRPWQVWHHRQRGICNLRLGLGHIVFESPPLRQSLIFQRVPGDSQVGHQPVSCNQLVGCHQIATRPRCRIERSSRVSGDADYSLGLASTIRGAGAEGWRSSGGTGHSGSDAEAGPAGTTFRAASILASRVFSSPGL